MADLNILTEIAGKKRDKIYVCRAYLDLLEEGLNLHLHRMNDDTMFMLEC